MSKQRKRRTAAQRQAEHQELLARRAQRLAEEKEAAEPVEPVGREDPAPPADPDPEPEELVLPQEPAVWPADEEDEAEARRAYEEGRAYRRPAQPKSAPSGELPDWRAVTEEVKRSKARREAQAAPGPVRRTPEEEDRQARESAMSDIDRAAAAFAGQSGRAARSRKARRGSGALRAMAILAACLAVLFAVLSGTSIVLYNRYNPDGFIQKVIGSLADGGQGLGALAVSDDLNALDADTLAPLTDYFSDAGAREALAAQLADQVIDPQQAGEAFPALGVEKTPVFLGYCEYRLRIDAVELVVTSSAQNLLLSLNGQPRTGQPTADGVLYTGLVPGRYTAQVTAADATGQQVTGQETTLDLFDSAAPTAFSGALPMGDLTITGCPSDEAVIAVNGVEVAQKPQDGVVKLQQIALNSTISFTYTQEWGAVTTGSVTFSDAAVTDLAFGGIATTGGIPASADVDLMLGAYYASYLNARNSKDASLLTGLTEDWRTALGEQLAAEEAGGRVYTYTNTVCLPASLTLHTEGEKPAFWAAAALAYTYSEGSATAVPGVMYQAVEFVYENGGWLVNRAVNIDEASFNAGNTSALQEAAPASASSSGASAAA